MPNKTCFVANCKSGYSSSKEKCALFSVTKERLNLWSEAIPPRIDRQLTTKDCVCEKHFNPELISREWKAPNSTITIPLAKCKLAEGAIPTIFHCYSTKKLPKKRKPADRHDSVAAKKPKNKVDSNLEIENSIIPIDDLGNNETPSVQCEPPSNRHDEIATVAAPTIPKIEVESNSEIGNSIIPVNDSSNNEAQCTDLNTFKLPSKNWTVCKVDISVDKEMTVFTEIFYSTYLKTAVIRKKITAMDSTIQIFYGGKLLSSKEYPAINTEILKEVLETCSQSKVCSGGPSISEYKNTIVSCGYKDFITSSWRHQDCEIFYNTGYCKSCFNLFATLRNAQKRQLIKAKLLPKLDLTINGEMLKKNIAKLQTNRKASKEKDNVK